MKLAIYGTGGSGREVFELIQECDEVKKNWEEIIFIDDTQEEGIFHQCKRYPFSIFKEIYSADEIRIIIAVGEPKYRKMLYDRVKEKHYKLGNIIHSEVKISPSAVLGEGIVLQEGVRIYSNAVIGNNVYINGRTIIGHDVKISSHCQISCNVVLAGCSSISQCTYIGVAACLRDHITVGENSVISMGAIVLKDVHSNKVVMGNPAREIANNTGQNIFKK